MSHAADLAKEHALDELGKLHEEPTNAPGEIIHRRRQKCYRILSKLAPGKGDSLRALKLADGSIVTASEDIAEGLRKHWGQIFSCKPTDGELRKKWVEEERVHTNVTHFAHGEGL